MPINPALTLAEAVVESAVAFLQAELPGQLDAIEAQINDGVELPPIIEWIKGERIARDYPACWVLCPDSFPDIDENRDSHDGFFPAGLLRHTLEVVVALTDPDDPERLRIKLYRYLRAIHEVFRRNESYDLNVSEWIRARVVGHNYSRVFQNNNETLFRQDATVLVQVWRAD